MRLVELAAGIAGAAAITVPNIALVADILGDVQQQTAATGTWKPNDKLHRDSLLMVGVNGLGLVGGITGAMMLAGSSSSLGRAGSYAALGAALAAAIGGTLATAVAV